MLLTLNRNSPDVMRGLTDRVSGQLAANLSLGRTVLSPSEIAAAQSRPWLGPVQYGNAVERLVAQQVRANPQLRQMFRHVGGANNPEFVGRGFWSNMTYDIKILHSHPPCD